MNNKKEPVILHFHLFKNAGSTVEWIFTQNFSPNVVRMDTDHPSKILSNEVVLNYLHAHPKVKFFSSHQLRLPIPESSHFQFIPSLFIRHPIDRISSIYSFNRRRSDINTVGVAKAKSLSLNDYLKWNFQVKNNVVRNFQVLFLSDKRGSTIPNEEDFRVAVNRMKSFPVLGVVDRFDESIVLAQEFLRKYFPKIDMSYVKQNISSERSLDLSESIEKEKSKVEKNVMNELVEKNQLDLKLYLKTNQELDNRIKTIDNFDEKLRSFQKKCQKLNSIISKLQKKQMPRTEHIFYSMEFKNWYYVDQNGEKIICK